MKPVIILPSEIKNKIQFIVDNCDMEVSGLGTVVYDQKENGYRVTSAILLPQEVGSAHTDLDDSAVAQALYETRNNEGELAFWWHSHVNMTTFWSSTDHDTMDKIGKGGICVAIVFNKKEEMRGAVVMQPTGFPASKHDDVSIITEYKYEFNTTDLLNEIKEKVKPKKYTPSTINEHRTHTSMLGSDASVYANLAISPVEKQMALDEWSKMNKDERKYYTGFPEFLKEYVCGYNFGSEPDYANVTFID